MTDAAHNAAPPKSRRRWYQFGLRTLLNGVMLAGCGFAWLGLKVREARQQQAAVAAIEKLGGTVDYDYQFDSRGDYLQGAVLPGPAFFRALLGDDSFRSVHSVHLTGMPVSDADVWQLTRRFPRLKQLEIDDTQVSDAGLEPLSRFRELEDLRLSGTRVTDAGLKHLAGMPNLKVLTLRQTNVTDAGLKHLAGMSNLEMLDLYQTNVTDAGLAHLECLHCLNYLRLFDTRVTAAGVANLQRVLPKCQIESDY